MEENNKRAQEYRRLARQCLEIASRMSRDGDREHVRDMASRWMELAARAENSID